MSGSVSRQGEGLTAQTTDPDATAGRAAAGEGSRPTGTTPDATLQRAENATLVRNRTGLTLDQAADLLNDHRGDRAPTTPAELARLTGELRTRMLRRIDELVAAQAEAKAEQKAPDSQQGDIVDALAADKPGGETS
jgi:hypothetical protein